jgi:hypothetical protein
MLQNALNHKNNSNQLLKLAIFNARNRRLNAREVTAKKTTKIFPQALHHPSLVPQLPHDDLLDLSSYESFPALPTLTCSTMNIEPKKNPQDSIMRDGAVLVSTEQNEKTAEEICKAYYQDLENLEIKNESGLILEFHTRIYELKENIKKRKDHPSFAFYRAQAKEVVDLLETQKIFTSKNDRLAAISLAKTTNQFFVETATDPEQRKKNIAVFAEKTKAYVATYRCEARRHKASVVCFGFLAAVSAAACVATVSLGITALPILMFAIPFAGIAFYAAVKMSQQYRLGAYKDKVAGIVDEISPARAHRTCP